MFFLFHSLSFQHFLRFYQKRKIKNVLYNAEDNGKDAQNQNNHVCRLTGKKDGKESHEEREKSDPKYKAKQRAALLNDFRIVELKRQLADAEDNQQRNDKFNKVGHDIGQIIEERNTCALPEKTDKKLTRKAE